MGKGLATASTTILSCPLRYIVLVWPSWRLWPPGRRTWVPSWFYCVLCVFRVLNSGVQQKSFTIQIPWTTLNLICHVFILKYMGLKPSLDCHFRCVDECNGLYTYWADLPVSKIWIFLNLYIHDIKGVSCKKNGVESLLALRHCGYSQILSLHAHS